MNEIIKYMEQTYPKDFEYIRRLVPECLDIYCNYNVFSAVRRAQYGIGDLNNIKKIPFKYNTKWIVCLDDYKGEPEIINNILLYLKIFHAFNEKVVEQHEDKEK